MVGVGDPTEAGMAPLQEGDGQPAQVGVAGQEGGPSPAAAWAWPWSARPTTRTVDTQIYNLRRKLETNPDRPEHLLTIHGVGYRLRP